MEQENRNEKLTIEERKIQLEEKRLNSEIDKSEKEIELRKIEFDIKRKNENHSRFSSFSPLATAIIGGILGLLGTAVGTYYQGSQNLELEKKKFEFNKQIELQKQKHELITKMISTDEIEQASKNLLFLVNAGLIEDSLHLIAKLASEPINTPVLPSLNKPRTLESDEQNILIDQISSPNQKISDSARDAFLSSRTSTPQYNLLRLIEIAIINKNNIAVVKNTLMILERYGPYSGPAYERAFSILFLQLKPINDDGIKNSLERLRKKTE